MKYWENDKEWKSFPKKFTLADEDSARQSLRLISADLFQKRGQTES